MSTAESKDYFKRNLIPISTLAVLVGFIVQQSKWQQKIEDDVTQLKTDVSQHKNDRDKHISLSDFVLLFVPRVELDKDLKNLDDKMDANAKNINDKLDNMNSYLKKNLN